MTKSTHLEDYVRFMGFRDCPACGEMLFAAERAEFVSAYRVTLRWRCDFCDHAFQTDVDARYSTSARAA